MKKTYCDICEQEIEGARKPLVSNRININGGAGKLVVEIRFGTTDYDTKNIDLHGDVCQYCVLDAVAKLDDRPKPDPEYEHGMRTRPVPEESPLWKTGGIHKRHPDLTPEMGPGLKIRRAEGESS